MTRDLLFLTQRIPFPPKKGEKIRSFNMLKELSRNWRVHLGCLVDDPEEMRYDADLAAYVADAHYAQINPKLARITCLNGLLTGEPLSYTYFADHSLKRWARRVLEEVRPEAALVCSSNMAQYLVGNGPRPRTVVADFVDVDSEKWRAYAEQGDWPMRLVYGREHLKVLHQEEAIAEYADAVSFVSDAEAQLFRDMFPQLTGKVFGISNGVDSEYFSPEHGFAPLYDTSVPTYVFCGTMDYPPNVEAVIWFADEILPLIRRTQPDAAFCIVGARPSAAVNALNTREGVQVTGPVDDVRPYVAHATASVAPMRVARGIQNKVLEAMAMARPVIVTPEGLEGIHATPGSHVLLASDTADFAAAVLHAAASPDSADIGRAARTLVVEQYSWQAHMGKFDTLLDPTPGSAELAS